MPMLVRNAEPNATVFAKTGISILWGPAGDPAGNDLQRVPDALKDDVDFIASVERGTLVVEDASDPAVLESIAQQSATFRAHRERAATTIATTLDRRQDRDLVSLNCIGPGQPGRSATCGQPVLQRSAQMGETPPLCQRHQGLAANFYLAEEGSVGEGDERGGKVSKTWKAIPAVRA
jgi:hypothetical protein